MTLALAPCPKLQPPVPTKVCPSFLWKRKLFFYFCNFAPGSDLSGHIRRVIHPACCSCSLPVCGLREWLYLGMSQSIWKHGSGKVLSLVTRVNDSARGVNRDTSKFGLSLKGDSKALLRNCIHVTGCTARSGIWHGLFSSYSASWVGLFILWSLF